MRQNIKRITEKDLHKIVNESVKRIVKEAINGGWEVDSSEAQEAYNFAVQELGKETVDDAIIRNLNEETLAQCLVYMFRMYEFKEWYEYKNAQNEENFDF